jgi:hypothetical protein
VLAAAGHRQATNITEPLAMTKSWRDDLKIHPAADLFPLLSPDELRKLGEDIIKNGLASPIVLWSNGKSPALLLDGRNRLDAIEIATGGPVIIGAPSLTAGKDFLARDRVIVLEKWVDPYAYVISANIHRRHLTAEQKRELIGKVLRADPSKSDREIGRIVKADNKTVASVRAEREAREEIPHVENRTDSKGRQQRAKKSKPKTQVSDEILPQRAAAAERIRGPMHGKAPDDVGPTSSGESERKDTELEELRNARLSSEVRDLRDQIIRTGEKAAENYIAATDAIAANAYGAMLDAWRRASAGDRRRFREFIEAEARENGEAPPPPRAR